MNLSNPTSHPRRPTVAGVFVLLVAAGLSIGCASTSSKVPTKKSSAAQPAAARGTKDTGTGDRATGELVSDAPVRARSTFGPVVGAALQVDLRPLGLIPTDKYTLPLLSPDGRLFAVQTGAVPDIATLLARPGQRPATASRISIYRADPRGLVRLGETESGLILGRAADARGFLVESARPDGSRWIGRVAWSGGDPEWLVQDGRVNAFATLGPAGELAYATRDLRQRVFDLVVLRDGQKSTLLGDDARSFVMPCFSSDGSRVFSIVLRDGILELASVDPTSSASLQQSLVRAFISDRADDATALQMLAPQGVRDGVDGADWILFHPVLGTLVRWNEVDGIRPFEGRALAAAAIDADRTALLLDGRVRIRSRGDRDVGQDRIDRGTVLFDATAVPRRCAPVEGASSVILIVPDPSGVRLLIARLQTAAVP
jgi:hypothetical protein